jgi:toxin ParE1/3/4
MERKIVWTERASGDIEAIVRYIARRNPSAASRIGQAIYDRVQILQLNPEAGTVLNELRAGGWRKLVFRGGRSSIRFEGIQSSLVGSGRQPREKRI